MCVYAFIYAVGHTGKSNKVIGALLAFANIRCDAIAVGAATLTYWLTLSQGAQPQLITVKTVTLVRSFTKAILTGLFTDRSTHIQHLVALVAEIARTFIRRITTPICAIRQTPRLAFCGTAVDEIVALIAGTLLRLNALSINAGFTAFRFTDGSILQIVEAFDTETYIRTHALASLAVHAVWQAVSGFCVSNITFAAYLVHVRVRLFDCT